MDAPTYEDEMESVKRRHEIILAAIRELHARHREELHQRFWAGICVGTPVGMLVFGVRAWCLGGRSV